MSSISSQHSDLPAASSSPRHEPADTSELAIASSAATNASTTSFTFVLNDPSHPSKPALEQEAQRDRFAHTRTKRKRTSPADFAILEREYEQEARPDKTLRAQIASKVSLNEKEVQIWFQNRRQMTRRKARTWQPNEISEIIRSSHTQDSGSPPSSQEEIGQSQESNASSNMDGRVSEPSDKPAKGIFKITSPSTYLQSVQTADEGVDTEFRVGDGVEVAQSVSTSEGGALSTVPVPDNLPNAPVSAAAAAAATEEEEEEEEATHLNATEQSGESGSQQHVPKPAERALKRSSSRAHLRMSLDGKAEIVLDKNSPSPPSKSSRRESWPARGGLRRSISAFTPSPSSLEQTSADVPASTSGLGQQRELIRPAGRSRDSRAWQFYCDPDAKDALTIAAEHDRKGTAQAAISLIRSNSGTAGKGLPGSPLTPNLGRHNSRSVRGPYSRTQSAADGLKTSGKRKSGDDLPGARPKLPRTLSSVARLQNTASAALQSYEPLKSVPSSQSSNITKGKGGGIAIFRDGDSDSDKENWRPGTRVSAPSHPRRGHTSSGARSALSLNTNELSHEASLGALMASKTSGNARPRRTNSAKALASGASCGDDEVASFMGEHAQSSSSDDLDAVQNLLSLSQGGRW